MLGKWIWIESIKINKGSASSLATIIYRSIVGTVYELNNITLGHRHKCAIILNKKIRFKIE